jgi:hypothetical protein
MGCAKGDDANAKGGAVASEGSDHPDFNSNALNEDLFSGSLTPVLQDETWQMISASAVLHGNNDKRIGLVVRQSADNGNLSESCSSGTLPLPVPLLKHHQNPHHGAVITRMLAQMLPK